MVSLRGFNCVTLYKMLRSTIIYGCYTTTIPKGEEEEDRIPSVSRENIILWHQIFGHNGYKFLHELQGKGMVEGMSNHTLNFHLREHFLYCK